MTIVNYTPGPRQTVDRCCHPTLGEGIAVYNNGPAWFRADSGEVVPMKRIGGGGWCKDKGSWLSAVQEDGTNVHLDVTKREHGTTWGRAVGQHHGPGWLGLGGKRHPSLDWAMWLRFEPDAGVPVEMWIEAMWVGLPKHDTMTKRLSKKAEKSIREERKGCPWMSMKSIDGSFFVYQREEDYRPEPVVTVESTAKVAPEQMGLPL